MKASIRNWHAIARADIEVAPIALISGINGAGKSSICEAVAAALTLRPIPFLDPSNEIGRYKETYTKTDMKEFVHAGADSGHSTVAEGADLATVSWPGAECKSQGAAYPRAGVFSAGLMRIMDLPENQRFDLFSGILKAWPTKDDLFHRMKDDGLDPEKMIGEGDAAKRFVDRLWEALDQNGWDDSYRKAGDTGKKFKGMWEQATGEKYGAKKGEGWKPEGFTNDLLNDTVEALSAKLGTARTRLEAAIGAVAVDDAAVVQLGKEVRQEEAITAELAKLVKRLEAAKQKVAESSAKLAAIVIPAATQNCPHCDMPIEPRQSGSAVTLHKPIETNVNLDKLKADRKVAQEVYKTSVDAHRAIETDVLQFEADLKRVAGADGRLEKASKKSGSQDAVDVARDLESQLQKHLHALSTYTEATKIHENIKRNQIIIDILAPEGLRRAKLMKAVETFNRDVLMALSQIAKFEIISIDDKMQVRYGGRLYMARSSAERYRVDAVLKIVIAISEKASCAVFDGADILDKAGRNGLFSLLRHIAKEDKIMSVVGMTSNTPDTLPDLKKAGLGHTYWLEGGMVKLVDGQPLATQ